METSTAVEDTAAAVATVPATTVVALVTRQKNALREAILLATTVDLTAISVETALLPPRRNLAIDADRPAI